MKEYELHIRFKAGTKNQEIKLEKIVSELSDAILTCISYFQMSSKKNVIEIIKEIKKD